MNNIDKEKEIIKMAKDDKLNESLKYYALSLTQSITEAEDLVQYAWYKILQNKEKIERKNPTWRLYTAIRYQFINNYRKNKKYTKVAIETDYQREQISQNTHNMAESNMVIQHINNAVNNLKDPRKNIMTLYLQERKYKDIAAELDIPLGTVQANIYKAKRELIKELETLGITP